MSHTASLAGSDEIFDAACRQAGIIRTRDVIHAFDIAEALSKQPLPRGNGVGIVSGGGGECVCSTDACNGYGLAVPELADEAVDALSAHLLPHAPKPKNPIDLAADPRHMTVAHISEFLARQPAIDAMIVRAPTWGIRPSSVKEALNAADIISRIPERYGKPVIATALRRERSGVVYELMRERNIPTYEFPEEAARAIYGLFTYSSVLKRVKRAL
jgi:acetyltransferase